MKKTTRRNKPKYIWLILLFLFFLIFALTMYFSSASDNVVSADVDGDGRTELAQDGDSNLGNGYESFTDADGSSRLILVKDGNADGKTDLFIDTNNDGLTEKYWNPTDGKISDVVVKKVEDTVKATQNEWIFDSDGDGFNDAYYSPSFEVVRSEPGLVNLVFTKSVSKENPYPGERIVYSYTVTNNGDYSASGVVATNVFIPAAFSSQSATTSQGTYNGATGVWTIGKINAGANAVLNIGALIAENFCDTVVDVQASVSFTTASSSLIASTTGADIRVAADASYIGEEAGDKVGLAVGAVGDINGDGFDDLSLGASNNANVNQGKDYVIFGKAAGWEKNASLATANVKYYDSRVNHTYLGKWPLNSVDVNGDGIKDLILSEWDNNSSGYTYVILGKTSAWTASVDVATALGFYTGSFISGTTGDTNSILSNVGDVNGDGYDDFFIGGNSSKSYLVFGRVGGWPDGAILGTTSAITFLKESVGTGNNLAMPAGDVNDDGYNDFVMADESFNDDRGKVYLILGKASGWETIVELGTSSDASFLGEDNFEGFDSFTTSINKLGDINNDGFDDLGFFSIYNSQSAFYAGKAYLVFGKSSGWERDTEIGTSSDASFLGEGPAPSRDYLGDIRNIGDVNGDGIDDLGLNAYNRTENNTSDGKIYVILGKTSGWSKNVNVETAADASFVGTFAREQLDAIIPIGDYNADGYDDFVVNGWGNWVYLILGRSSGWTKDRSISASAHASYVGETEIVAPSWGLGVSGRDRIGDINGDGYQDIVLDQEINDEGGADAGKIYILFGKADRTWLIEKNFADDTTDAPEFAVQCNRSHPYIGPQTNKKEAVATSTLSATSTVVDELKKDNLEKDLVEQEEVAAPEIKKYFYKNPRDEKKYDLNTPEEMFYVMRKYGLGASHKFLSQKTFPPRVLGMILLDVQKKGEAYYISPYDRKKYYLGRPAEALAFFHKMFDGK